MPPNALSHHFVKPMEHVKNDLIFTSNPSYFALALALKHTMFT